MTDGVMGSRHNNKNENKTYGSWAAHDERAALVLLQCVQLRGLRKRSECGSLLQKMFRKTRVERKSSEGGTECPLTPTPLLMAASPRSRLVKVDGREFVKK